LSARETAGIFDDAARRILDDEFLRLTFVAQVDLHAFGAQAELSEELRVLREVLAVLLAHLAEHPLDDLLIDIATAEVRVATGTEHRRRALVLDADHGHVERAAAEVIDHERLRLALVESIGNRGRRGLVDDRERIETRDLRGLGRRVLLRLLEVRRHRDHGVVDRLADHALGSGLELLEDARADKLGIEIAAAGARHGLLSERIALAHDALDLEDHVAGLARHLLFRRFSDGDLSRVRDVDDRRRGRLVLAIRDHLDLALRVAVRGDDRVGRSEVDADYLVIFRHGYSEWVSENGASCAASSASSPPGSHSQ
jgi:hypothetical protein